jgi:hypothetical protein
MGIHSKTKGKCGEREAAAELMEWWKLNGVRRSVQYSGGDGTADLAGTGRLHVEVKRRRSIKTVTDWLEQAERDASATGNIPVVVFRQDGAGEWVAMMRLKDAPAFAREIQTLTGEPIGTNAI